MSYGSIYPVTWWGSPLTDGFGAIYYDLVDNVINEYLNELQNRATNYENEANTTEILEALDDCGLLEDSTLVITPTGYSEGVLHSTKPPISLSEELVINGDFSNGSTGWDLNAGCSLISGGAVRIEHTPTAGVLTYLDPFLKVGSVYIFSYEITENNAGALKLNSAQDVSMDSGIGVHTKKFQASSTSFNIARAVSAGTDVVIDNISVKEVLSADLDYTRTGTTTRTNSEGNIETIAEDVPVINYENFTYDKPDLVTNGDFDTNSDWIFNSPWSYDSVNKQATGTFAGTFENLVQLGIMTSGATYDVTLDADLSGITAGSLKFSNSSFSDDGTARTILDGVNTYTLTANSTDLRIGGGGATGTGIIKNVTLRETGAVITDYDAHIVIEDGAVINGGFEDLFDPQNGTLFVRSRNKAHDSTRRQLILEDATSQDRIVFRFEATANRVQAVLRDNGSGLSTITSDLDNTLEFKNYVLTWTNGDFKFYVDGVLQASRTPDVTGLAGISTLRTDSFNGDIELLNVYKRVLTQEEITCINGKI